MNASLNPTENEGHMTEIEESRMRNQLHSFKVDQLKMVLSDLKLSKTGRKAELLDRILNFWRIHVQENYIKSLKNAVEKAVNHERLQRLQANPYTVPSTSNPNFVRPQINFPTAAAPRMHLMPPLPAPILLASPILIEGSLLYQEIKTISTVRVGANFQKPPVHIRFKLDDRDADLMDKLEENGERSRHKIILVCGRPIPTVVSIVNPPAARIEYPSGTHAFMNGIHLNTLFMCDSHVELTNVSIRGPNELRLSFYHAPTPYAFVVKIVKIRNESEILSELQDKKLTKEVILENRKKRENDDDDIIAGDEIVELLDPFSRCRISLPARGRKCKHTQCFDAFTYLQINKSSPKMECPICYSKLPLSQLVVDAFFEEILKETSEEVEQVHVSLDGKWSLINSNQDVSVVGKENSTIDEKNVHTLASQIVLVGDSPQKKQEPIIIILDSDED